MLFKDKDLGVVFTPPKTVDYIISRLGPISNNSKILDPCVGPGIFVERLLEFGVNKHQIFTFDINPKYKKEIEQLGVSFNSQDYLLSIFPDSYNQYDFIVGNPPYLNKASEYIRQNKKKLKKIYGKINSHETYAMFIINSIWRLKEGGKLGFITSDSFLTLNTHTRLRKFILDNCKIEEILLAPTNLFDNQNVTTNPAIIILSKCPGKVNKKARQENVIKIIPRIKNEEEYHNPNNYYDLQQKKYETLPFNLFFIDIEEEIIDLFEKSPKLKNYIKGHIGMHTHNNLKHIAAIEDTELADIFRKRNEKSKNSNKMHKIISKEEFDSNKWKSYLKRGGADQYYRPIMEALDWAETSIPNYDIPQNVPFESEGIVISGVSSRLAARYMPKGCYWDSNKAIGCIIRNNSISIYYALGVLNSSLYNYLAKGIINNTYSIQISGIHALPFILPDNDIKVKVERIVKNIIENKKQNLNYDYKNDQMKIDDIVYDFYAKLFNFPQSLKKKLQKQYSIYKKKN
ncbi:MAG: hypothetical protein EU535_01610 [Promethearchaeota archaeon]|nr:MAG: hypothetical protein EU535_01610 [Candidatus Lokiarchaeota archaeon]